MVFGGGRPRAFPPVPPRILNQVVKLGGVSVNTITFIIPAVTVLLLIGLSYFINKTKTGMAMRALSKDYETASLMGGIDINRIISITFFNGFFFWLRWVALCGGEPGIPN